MTPFDIRNNLITIANEYLQKQQELSKDFAEKTFNELVKSGEKLHTDYTQYMPKMYTMQDVIDKANELYGFVSNAKWVMETNPRFRSTV